MSRPITRPDFATDALYPAGSDSWSAQPNKVDPSGIVQTGFIPTTPQASDHMNFMLGNHGQYISYLENRSIWRCNMSVFPGLFGATPETCGDFIIEWTGAAPAGTSAITAYASPSLLTPALNNTEYVRVVSYGTAFIQASFICARFETDISMSAVGANNLSIFFGATDGSNSGLFNGWQLAKTSGNTQWLSETNAGGGTTQNLNLGTPVVNTFYRLRADMFGSGTTPGLSVRFYIDDVLVSTHTTGVEAAGLLIPHVKVLATANTANTVRIGPLKLQWSRVAGI